MGYSLLRTCVSTGCGPSGTDCSSMGPSGAAASARSHQEPAAVWAPLHGLQLHSGHVHLRGVLHRLQCAHLLYCGLLLGLQGNLYSGTCSTSSPSFSTDLGVCRAVSLSLFSLLSQLLCSIFYLNICFQRCRHLG